MRVTSFLFIFCLTSFAWETIIAQLKNDGDFYDAEKRFIFALPTGGAHAGRMLEDDFGVFFPNHCFVLAAAGLYDQRCGDRWPDIDGAGSCGCQRYVVAHFYLLQFAFGVSAGFCVVTSCNVGAHNPAGVRRSLTTQIVLSGVLTVVLTALALVLLNPMLAWINVTPDSPEVYRAAYTYCAIIFAGIGAQLFYNFICSFLRSMGDSVTPLAFLLFSTVLNVGLDLLFIIVFRWGVAGAAIATVAGTICACVMSFISVMHPGQFLSIQTSSAQV